MNVIAGAEAVKELGPEFPGPACSGDDRARTTNMTESIFRRVSERNLLFAGGVIGGARNGERGVEERNCRKEG